MICAPSPSSDPRLRSAPRTHGPNQGAGSAVSAPPPHRLSAPRPERHPRDERVCVQPRRAPPPCPWSLGPDCPAVAVVHTIPRTGCDFSNLLGSIFIIHFHFLFLFSISQFSFHFYFPFSVTFLIFICFFRFPVNDFLESCRGVGVKF